MAIFPFGIGNRNMTKRALYSIRNVLEKITSVSLRVFCCGFHILWDYANYILRFLMFYLLLYFKVRFLILRSVALNH